jgi:hypothetical protein
MAPSSDESRDSQLTAILRTAVDAPPLRPGFHEELEARLASAPGIRKGDQATSLPTDRRRPWTRRIFLAAAVVAAAAVFALAVLPALRGTDTATAGDVLAAMTASSGGAQTVRMHVVREAETHVSKSNDRNRDVADLTMDIRGDSLAAVTSAWSWKDDSGQTRRQSTSQTFGYDETRREQRSIPGAGMTVKSSVIRRPAWAADPAMIGDSGTVYSELAAQVRAALADTDASMPVRETTYLGRPAWRCVFTVHELWGPYNDIPVAFHWDATIDQATGLLVAASHTMDSKGKRVPMTWDLRVTRLELDPDLPEGWALPKPGGDRITVIDEGTRFGTPEEVAERSWPTLPLIPQWAPAGYRRTDVASAGFSGGTGHEGWSGRQAKARVVARKGAVTFRRADWPVEDQTVLVRFRRGFSTFTAQITPKPFGVGVGGGKPDVTLSAGYLKGKPAWFGDDASDGLSIGIAMPSLLTYSDRSRVLITGDLTRDELVQVANSMRVYGDEDRPLIPGYGD